jgi:hypothetical protein
VLGVRALSETAFLTPSGVSPAAARFRKIDRIMEAPPYGPLAYDMSTASDVNSDPQTDRQHMLNDLLDQEFPVRVIAVVGPFLAS